MGMTLGPKTRRAWELRQGGMTYREIAEVVGISPDGVGVLIYQAKKRLGIVDDGRARRRQGLAVLDATPGGARCGLRGEHICVGRAETYLGRRGEQQCSSESGRR